MPLAKRVRFQLLAKPIHPADLLARIKDYLSWFKRRLTLWLILSEWHMFDVGDRKTYPTVDAPGWCQIRLMDNYQKEAAECSSL